MRTAALVQVTLVLLVGNAAAGTAGTPVHNNKTDVVCGKDAFLEIHEMFDLYAAVMTMCAVVGVINYHKIRFPIPITLSLSALGVSIVLIGIDGMLLDSPIRSFVVNLLDRSEFAEIILDFGVGILLFGDAMESDIKTMGHRWGIIFYLSIFGVLASVAVIGGSLYGIFVAFGFYESSWHNFLICFLFGALVSSTDCHRFVLDALTHAGAPAEISAIHLGETLFNDGVAVLVFILFKKLVDAVQEESMDMIWADMAKELLGGIFIGLVFAAVVGSVMKKIRHPTLNTLLSVVLVLDCTMVANRLHSSAPMACVAAGLTLRGYFFEKLERRTQQEMDVVWVFSGNTLSGTFFLLIGFTIVSLPFSVATFFASLVAIPISLVGRYVTLQVLLRVWSACGCGHVDPNLAPVLSWGGLRGGATVALAMSLNNYEGRETVFSMCYAVVLFSLIVQGLTIPSVFHWLYMPEHLKRRGSTKLIGEKDDMLSRLMGAVERDPELAKVLEKQGIDAETLSRMSEHSGSNQGSRPSSPSGSENEHGDGVGHRVSSRAPRAYNTHGEPIHLTGPQSRLLVPENAGYGSSITSSAATAHNSNPPRPTPSRPPRGPGSAMAPRSHSHPAHRSNNDEVSPQVPVFQQWRQQMPIEEQTFLPPVEDGDTESIPSSTGSSDRHSSTRRSSANNGNRYYY